MPNMTRSIVLTGLAAAALATAPAQAQAQETSRDAAPDLNSNVTVGVAAAYLPDYEGSDDYRFAPAPAAVGSIRGFNFTLLGNRLSVDLIPDRPGPGWDFQAGPVAVLNLNRTSRKGVDDRRIKALDKLDTGIEVGGFVGIGKTGVITSDYDKLSISVSYRKDIAGASKGSVWQPSVSYFTPLSRKAAVGLSASADFVSDRYARYYFSVSPSESIASGLPVYVADGGGKSYTLGAFGTVAVTGDLLHGVKLVAGGSYKRLVNDFADTPIVSLAGDRTQWLGAVGLAYTF